MGYINCLCFHLLCSSLLLKTESWCISEFFVWMLGSSWNIVLFGVVANLQIYLFFQSVLFIKIIVFFYYLYVGFLNSFFGLWLKVMILFCFYWIIRIKEVGFIFAWGWASFFVSMNVQCARVVYDSNCENNKFGLLWMEMSEMSEREVPGSMM